MSSFKLLYKVVELLGNVGIILALITYYIDFCAGDISLNCFNQFTSNLNYLTSECLY